MVISNKQTRRWTGWTNKKSTWANKQASKQTTQKSLKKIAISIFNGKCADKNKFFFIYSRASRELASLLGKMTAIRCKKAKKINLTTRWRNTRNEKKLNQRENERTRVKERAGQKKRFMCSTAVSKRCSVFSVYRRQRHHHFIVNKIFREEEVQQTWTTQQHRLVERCSVRCPFSLSLFFWHL